MEVELQEETVGSPDVKIKKTAKTGDSKIFACVMECLSEKKHLHMLKFTDRKNGEFQVTFMDKKNPQWTEKHISLFKDMDSVVPHKNQKHLSKDRYEVVCKTRAKANFSKLCDSKYLQILRTKKQKPYTFNTYKILKNISVENMKAHAEKQQRKACKKVRNHVVEYPVNQNQLAHTEILMNTVSLSQTGAEEKGNGENSVVGEQLILHWKTECGKNVEMPYTGDVGITCDMVKNSGWVQNAEGPSQGYSGNTFDVFKNSEWVKHIEGNSGNTFHVVKNPRWVQNVEIPFEGDSGNTFDAVKNSEWVQNIEAPLQVSQDFINSASSESSNTAIKIWIIPSGDGDDSNLYSLPNKGSVVFGNSDVDHQLPFFKKENSNFSSVKGVLEESGFVSPDLHLMQPGSEWPQLDDFLCESKDTQLLRGYDPMFSPNIMRQNKNTLDPDFVENEDMWMNNFVSMEKFCTS